jgi:hypothetical protein
MCSSKTSDLCQGFAPQMVGKTAHVTTKNFTAKQVESMFSPEALPATLGGTSWI